MSPITDSAFASQTAHYTDFRLLRRCATTLRAAQGEQCSANSLLLLGKVFRHATCVKNDMEQQWNIRLCPRCGGVLNHVPPRFVDRLLSPGRYRFQCESQECYWIGNLPIEGTNSTRFGLSHGLIAGFIVVIIASVALGLFGLFTIHRERAEVAATHNQSPSTTPSVMRVDDPQAADEVFSVGVAQIGKFDLVAGAPKGRNPAGSAPKLPTHPVAACAANRTWAWQGAGCAISFACWEVPALPMSCR